jgi:hypothetical protein
VALADAAAIPTAVQSPERLYRAAFGRTLSSLLVARPGCAAPGGSYRAVISFAEPQVMCGSRAMSA